MNIEAIVALIKEDLMAENGELERACYRWIQKTCREETSATVEVVDCGYDKSSFGHSTGDKIDTSQFVTVGDFLDYPTGASVPTFISGSGMRAETYDERFEQFIRDQIWEWVEKKDLMKFIVDEMGMVDDEFCDMSCDNSADALDFAVIMSEKPFPKLKVI